MRPILIVVPFAAAAAPLVVELPVGAELLLLQAARTSAVASAVARSVVVRLSAGVPIGSSCAERSCVPC
jgi:hypothetical protein